MNDKFIGYENDIDENKIISVQINLTNSCSSHCKSCRKYLWPKCEMDLELIKRTLLYLKKQNCSSVFFSGGEPLMFSKIYELIDFCNQIKMPYSLITTLIIKDEKLLELIAKTAYRIHVSVDAVKSKLYEEIRGVNAFDLVNKNIQVINNNRSKDFIPIRFSSTIGIFNYNSIFDIYNFAKKNNCLVNFYFLHTWDNLKMSEEQILIFKDGLLNIAEDETKNNKRISNALMLFESFYNVQSNCQNICLIPNISLIIDSNGDVYPCCRLFGEVDEYGKNKQYSYGNITNIKNDSDFEKLFSKRLSNKYPLDNSLCKECATRYMGQNLDLLRIKSKKKNPIFI